MLAAWFRVRQPNVIPLNVRQQLTHHLRSLVSVLHLVLLHLLEDTSDKGIERDGEDHDADANKGRPPKNIIERHESQGNLADISVSNAYR